MDGEFSIYVRAFLSNRLYNKKFGLSVRPTDTIHDVMEQLEERSGVAPMMQRLTWHCNRGGPMLLDHDTPGTLADLGIDKHAESFTSDYSLLGYHELCRQTVAAMGLAVDWDNEEDDMAEEVPAAGEEEEKTKTAKTMRIYVEDKVQTRWPRVRKLALEVDAGDTVASIRERVHRRWGYPPEMQEIWPKEGPGQMVPDCGGTLADYYHDVTDGSTLQLFMWSAFAAAFDLAERKRKKAKMASPPTSSPPAKSVE
ncbi:hypothetical protein ACP4OV_002870 [Aristida adscensionis]